MPSFEVLERPVTSRDTYRNKSTKSLLGWRLCDCSFSTVCGICLFVGKEPGTMNINIGVSNPESPCSHLILYNMNSNVSTFELESL